MAACLSRFTNLRTLELWYWFDMSPKDTTPLTQAITSLLASTSLSLMGWDHGNNVSDLRLILSACSVSLEHLTIACYNHLGPHAVSAVGNVVCLEALSKLELFDLSSTATPFGQLIVLDCPNLQVFAISQELSDDGPWGLPSCIPTRIAQLNLHGAPHFDSLLAY